jgi:hypothetical protein
VSEIEERLLRSPNKSLRKLSAESVVSYSSARKSAKILGMRPYKMTRVQELLPADFERRLKFCKWYRSFIKENEEKEVFYSDEAWFHLNGYVNSQNARHWSTENPNEMVQAPLHPLKIGVWCALSKTRIIGPIYFTDTISAQRYKEILEKFVRKLRGNDISSIFFQQDGAPAHRASMIKKYLHEIFPDRVIGMGFPYDWPPRSPDLTPLDFFLWGFLKSKVYINNPKTLDQLKSNINAEIGKISAETLQKVAKNMETRVLLCEENAGKHFEHLL